jgi:DNA-binding transcriptional LysR family regulator
MEIRQLEALEAVLETGSFTAAARRRHLTQPALWSQIRSLEEELGVRLFARAGRGIQPTSACQTLRSQLRRALDDLASLKVSAAEIREGRMAPARIGCAQYHVPYFLADAIAEQARLHPASPFPTIVPVSSATASSALRDGAIDLVVQPRPEANAFQGFALYPVWLVAVGPPVTGETLDVRALDGLPVATFPRDSGARMIFDDACKHARVAPRIVHEDRDAATLLALARRKLCTSILISEALGAADLRRSARLASGRREFQGDLWLLWRTEESLSPAARILRDVIRKKADARRG